MAFQDSWLFLVFFFFSFPCFWVNDKKDPSVVASTIVNILLGFKCIII